MFYYISRAHLRLAFKLAFAVVLALIVGFHFQLTTPRWAVMTAGIIAMSPAFIAGGEPYSGAVRYRGMLRIIGTIIGSLAALIMIVFMVRAPVLMLAVSCVWVGFCAWGSSLVKLENSYAVALSGYTALIIVITTKASPLLAPQIAIERCSEIIIGILCAIVADIVLSPRSIKQEIDKALDALLLSQYRLMQLCIAHGDGEEVDNAWRGLLQHTKGLEGMRGNLATESSRWGRAVLRLKSINTLSLTLITQAYETYLIQNNHPEAIPDEFRALFAEPIDNIQDLHQKLKTMRRIITWTGSDNTPRTIYAWVGAATRYLLLKRGVMSNVRISAIEQDVLNHEPEVKPASPERHRARVNFWRTTIACLLGTLFWLWTGWQSGSAAVIMIAVETILAMRAPNPVMAGVTFVVATLVAVPLGAFYFLFVLPHTQQSMLLLCIALGLLTFFIGIALQRRRLGSLGLLPCTLNLLVLSNPMTFNFSTFLDSALGQFMGCFIALIVILLIPDNSRDRTGKELLNQLMTSTMSALTTRNNRRKENYLPALYQHLFFLLNQFPGDAAKFHLALLLIIAQQRLRGAPIPVNDELQALHKKLRTTTQKITSSASNTARRRYVKQLIDELNTYQGKLRTWEAPSQVVESVEWLSQNLSQHQDALMSK